MGDLGNVVLSTNDEGYYNATQNTLIKLEGAFSVLGRSVILHRNPDNCVRLEGSGGDTSAGERIGHCIIGLVSESCTGISDGCTRPPIAEDDDQEEDAEDNNDEGVNVGVIVGAVVGGAFVLTLGSVVMMKRRQPPPDSNFSKLQL